MSAKGVIGLGKLGVPLAAALAAAGHEVVGLDTVPHIVCDLVNGEYQTCEPGLSDLLRLHRSRLTFTTDYANLAEQTDMAFIIVPTPSTPEAPAFDNRYVVEAVTKLTKRLVEQRRAGYHIVLVSTVMPGTCDKVLLPLLKELTSESPCGIPSLTYSPEFIALGNVLAGMQHPDLLLLGDWNQEAGQRVAAVLKSIARNDPPVYHTSWINAELAKLSINAALGWKITLGNILASVCEQFPGADCDQVAKVVGADSRIGPKLLKGGMGFGGPCLPRDIRALASLGSAEELFRQLQLCNEGCVDLAVHHIQHHVPLKSHVAVVGVAYKDGTPVLEDSQPLEVALALAATDRYSVHVCDSAIPANSQLARSFPQLSWHDSVESCVSCCRGIVLAKLTSQTQELAKLTLTPPCVIVDCWRQLAQEALPAGIEYIAFGRGD